ncbi:MAG TPA: carboxypeptidase-like regulatory domain-containing protein [Gemmataceae bacterium]
MRRSLRDFRGVVTAYGAWGVVAILLAVPTSVAPGQAVESKMRLVLSMKSITKEPERDPEQRRDVWLLRPNVRQEVLTYLQNDDPSQTPTVLVQLLSGGAVVASQKIEGVKGFIPVAWPRPTAPASGSTVAADELKRPAVLRLMDADGKTQLDAIELGVGRPSEYLKADIEFVPAGKRLIAKVEATDRFQAPPSCLVEMVLDPARLADFVPSKRGNVYGGKITHRKGEGSEVYLVADNVQLRGDKGKGMVAIRADGYERAFLFDATFARAATPAHGVKADAPFLRINVPPMADPRKPVHVTLEADNVAAAQNKRLVLDRVIVVERGGKGPQEIFSELAQFSGDRSERLLFAQGGPNKGLLFQTEVKDWSADLNLRELLGKVTLRARLLDDKDEAQTVADVESEDWKRADQVRKTIVLDDTEPENVRFEKLPDEATRGKVLPVQASGTDDESAIREVVFFLGQAQPDGKIPPGTATVAGERLKTKSGVVWAAELKVPKDQKDPLNVSVRFINGVGLSTTETVALNAIDPPAVKPKKASIAGTVMMGDLPQPGLKVELLNAGKAVKSTTTKTDGTFEFKDLDAGDYQVSAAKPGVADLKGSTPVKLADKEDKKSVVIKLWRQ